MPANPAKISLIVDASYHVEQDDVEAFASLALRMAATANRRDGCIFLKVAQDLNNPANFHLFEGWRDQAALDAHGASDEFQDVMKEAAILKIIERSAVIYSVDGAKTLDMPS